MLKLGIVTDYALGGATALIYYCEPFQTQDVDIFVVIEQESSVVSLAGIYDFLKKNGGREQGEYMIVNNIPVQFLVPYNTLVEEAVAKGVEVLFENEKVKIMSLEHLMAIMVQTGRGKDKARLEEIYQLEIPHDEKKFRDLLKQFALDKKWKEIQKGF